MAKVRDLLIISSITTCKLDSYSLRMDVPIVTCSDRVGPLCIVQGLNKVHAVDQSRERWCHDLDSTVVGAMERPSSPESGQGTSEVIST